MARGRPQRPHQCSWNKKLIEGLYHCPDGRWRINRTGQKFTEPDERRAVQRFLQMEKDFLDNQPVFKIPVAEATSGNMQEVTTAVESVLGDAVEYAPIVWHDGEVTPVQRGGAGPIHVEMKDGKLVFSREADEVLFWSTVREAFIHDAFHAAKMIGLPELGHAMRMGIPQDAIKLSDIIDVYRRENPSSDKAKREALSVFNRLIDHAQAKTLDDLTQAKLLSFRSEIEKAGSLKSAGTRKGYYGRIKSIISFGLKVGLDQTQITAALARCSVLWTAEPMPAPDPKPVSKQHFHRLLTTGNGSWRAWLLLGLNLCMYMEELCGLRWDELDLKAGTYASIRNKTRRHRIPRAAVLWKESIEALKAIPRRGEFVFTSSHGTRYNRNTRINDFKDLREKAKLPSDVTFATIRDGAYTAACRSRTDDKFARVLAGHKAAGLQDNYVLRHPEITRDACDAVYQAYAPFPASAAVPV